MTIRDDIIFAIDASLDAITDPMREDAGDSFAPDLAAAIAALDIVFPFPRSPTDAAAYVTAAQEALGSAVTSVFKNNAWRTAFSGAVADGILRGTGDDTPVFTVSYADLQAAATSKSILLLTMPPKYEFNEVIILVDTLFTGVPELRIGVGISGDFQRYLPLFDAVTKPGAAGATLDVPSLASFGTVPTGIFIYGEADINLSGLTAGSLRVCLRMKKLPF